MKRWILILAAGCLTLAPAAAAQDVARVWAGSGGIDFEPLVGDAGLVLTVTGPEGFYHRAAFASGEIAAFSILDEAGGVLPDGSYAYELRAVPQEVQRRDDFENGPVATESRRGSERLVQSGSFSIVQGAVVAGGGSEPGQHAAGSDPVLAQKTTILTTADGTIRNSLCVGTDCTGFESFGFDTLRLKENNTRIKFQDTSSAGSFPSNDWQITANDSFNGGADKLSIDDVDGGTTPFTIEAGAATHSLYVDSTERIGFGTSTPVLHLHVADGNTPGLRLEQDSSGGFTPQTWDVAGNEVFFFVRDATNATFPLRIRPQAPSNSLFVDASGDVGLGTDTPAARLDVAGSIAVSGTVDGRDVSADGATLDAHVTDFNNPHQVTAAQLGIEEGQTKAGIVPGADFSGNPAATATVAFAEPFPAGTTYAVVLTAVTSDGKQTFTPNVLAKSESGFTVTLGTGPSADLVEVGWLARPVDE